jgi:hypothetical protein
MTDNVKALRDTQPIGRPMPVWKRWWQQYARYFIENRASERRPSGAAAEVWWTDEYGARQIVRGVCVDLSRGGVGVVCPEPVPSNKLLQVRLESEDLVKLAHVRHCDHMGAAYLIGMQFCS